MTTTLRFGKLPLDRLAFAYSPGQEALHSLHVLSDARSHPLHVHWVVQARKRQSPALKAEIDRYELLVGRRMPVLWDVREARSLCTFDDDLATLRSAPPEFFVHRLLLAALGPSPADKLPPGADLGQQCAAAALRHPECAAVLTEAAADPARELARYADFLAGYWEACLAPDWDRIEEMFVADIERRGRRLVRRGVAGALDGLSADVRVDAGAGTCLITRPASDDLTLTEEDTLTLIPSYFAWPHLYMALWQPDVLITYPVLEQQQEGRAPVPPDRLLKLLRAAGDASRLQILQLVGARPRSTGELAGLIGISEAAVSKHLKQLQEAGLVEAERQSYYVFYRAARGPVEELSRGLDALLAGEEQAT
ncbi:MAG: ArsR family transcriptional regulator [Symbiobacteriaceae bacterium]|nr:ArsR family transcriptional regulator [Symbiobacteriaceae bacterium]